MSWKMRFLAAGVALFFTSSCVVPFDSVRPVRYPGNTYRGESCPALLAELAAIDSDLASYKERQGRSEILDDVYLSLGVLTLFLAVLLATTNDYSDQIAALKGQREALLSAAEKAPCPSVIEKAKSDEPAEEVTPAAS